MGWDAPWHWVVLAILVLLLFGYKKLPDASRSLGRSLRIFKAETKGLHNDDPAALEAGAEPVVTQPVTGKAVSEQPVAEPPARSESL